MIMCLEFLFETKISEQMQVGRIWWGTHLTKAFGNACQYCNYILQAVFYCTAIQCAASKVGECAANMANDLFACNAIC